MASISSAYLARATVPPAVVRVAVQVCPDGNSPSPSQVITTSGFAARNPASRGARSPLHCLQQVPELGGHHIHAAILGRATRM